MILQKNAEYVTWGDNSLACSYLCIIIIITLSLTVQSPRNGMRIYSFRDEAIKQGTCTSVNRIAKEYDVPRMTLQDCLSGRVQHSYRPGPKPYLNQHKKRIRDLAEVSLSVGYENCGGKVSSWRGTLRKQRISDSWFRCFLEGNHNLVCVKMIRQLF